MLRSAFPLTPSRRCAVLCRGAGWLAVLGWISVAAAGMPRLVPVTAAMPELGDHTALSWREGPPYFTTAPYASERRFLRLATGHYTVEFDTEGIALTGYAAHPVPIDEATATAALGRAEPLPPATLQLALHVGGTVYACVGRRPLARDGHGLPAQPLEFPVRLIEGGRFFQKFALHDLEFREAGGRRLPVGARLEVAAWPDRLAFTLVVRPERPLAGARAWLRLQTSGGRDASVAVAPADWAAAEEQRVTLVVGAAGDAVAPAEAPGLAITVTPEDPLARATVRWNAEEHAHEVRLEAPRWPAPAEGIYPEAKLDALEAYVVELRNDRAEPRPVRLAFNFMPPHAITGCVPLLLDADGRPTGVPVQISKNWHQPRAGYGPLPHAGPWLHGRTVLHLPPHSRVALRQATTFARWGGVPGASLAQLSLVGWGHNGFWEQFALGSFGETFCFQPGRAMRRALLTDFRPLDQRGFAQGERRAWTSNLGGGDTMVRLDPAGRYVPFRRNVTRYASHGPNLARLDYEETSADDAVHSRVTVLLPRSDDLARVYLRITYEVRRPVAFSALALFQLGADYYNDTNSPRLAWGTAAGLGEERQPGRSRGELPRWEAAGGQPWLSLHGQARADRDRAGQGGRGWVVREWRAVLGGKAVTAPWFAAVRSRGSGNRLGAEIQPPPGLAALAAGDRVEMLVELLALPIAAERYYGPDEGLRAALLAGANTWSPVWREAAGHRPEAELADGTVVRGVPLVIPAGAGRDTAFTLRGALGLVPVQITGLERPEDWELHRHTPAGRERVAQGEPDRAYWQADYDAGARRWSLTYNLPADGAGERYGLVPAARREPATVEVR
jgi:hypothetical protein